MKLNFSHKENIASNIWSFHFTPLSPIQFTPGQFIELNIPKDNMDDRGGTRWFTISSSPKDKYLTITTRIFDQSSTYKQYLMNLKKDSQLDFNGPMGDFVLPKIIETPLVLIAAGIGITPFLSMINYLYRIKEFRPIHLFWALDNENDIIKNESLDQYHLEKTLIINHPSDYWGGERGHLTPEMILDLTTTDNQTLYYISGPEKMVEDLSQKFKQLIKDENRIISDYFPGYITY